MLFRSNNCVPLLVSWEGFRGRYTGPQGLGHTIVCGHLASSHKGFVDRKHHVGFTSLDQPRDQG